PVAAERDRQVETGREPIGVGCVRIQARRAGVVDGNTDLDVVLDQPRRGAQRELVCERPVAVGYQTDDARLGQVRHRASSARCARSTASSRTAGKTVAPPRRACARNSTLPSAPRNGEGTTAPTPRPAASRPATTSLNTAACTARSRTTSRRPTRAGPASYCGFTS